MNILNDIEELSQIGLDTDRWEASVVRHWLLMPIWAVAPLADRILQTNNARYNLRVLKQIAPFLDGASATVPPYDEFVLIKNTYTHLLETLEAWEAFYKGAL